MSFLLLLAVDKFKEKKNKVAGLIEFVKLNCKLPVVKRVHCDTWAKHEAFESKNTRIIT